MVWMHILWCDCTFYGVNAPSMVWMYLLWCECTFYGVNAPSMVWMHLLWCECTFYGVNSCIRNSLNAPCMVWMNPIRFISLISKQKSPVNATVMITRRHAIVLVQWPFFALSKGRIRTGAARSFGQLFNVVFIYLHHVVGGTWTHRLQIVLLQAHFYLQRHTFQNSFVCEV